MSLLLKIAKCLLRETPADSLGAGLIECKLDESLATLSLYWSRISALLIVKYATATSPMFSGFSSILISDRAGHTPLL